MSKHPTRSLVHAIADLPVAQLAARVDKITAHLDAIDALMGDGVELTDAERKVALRLQDGEVVALDGVLAFAEARPELFVDLADEDEGNDPDTFETTLLRARLTNAEVLGKLSARVTTTLVKLSDSALYVTTLAKRPALAAYAIAKPFQARDRKHGALLNTAVNLYRGHALAAGKSRTAKKKSAAGGGSTDPTK